MIPVWGNGRASIDHFQNGRWVWGTIHAALAVSDVFLVKALVTGVVGGAWKLGLKFASRGSAKGITSGSQVTEQVIREAMKDAPLVSQQARGVSMPRVQQYVDKLLEGKAAPAIKVDGNIIVDGNHRYIAGKVLGQEPPIQLWVGGRPERVVPWETLPINPEPW